ncbi:hypothetical protein ACPZ19_16820 [Amycolatopsis lurida]
MSGWRRRYGPNFLTTALSDRAVWWSWKRCKRGWSFEIAFRTDGIRDEFIGQPAVKAAIDAALAMGATVTLCQAAVQRSHFPVLKYQSRTFRVLGP